MAEKKKNKDVTEYPLFERTWVYAERRCPFWLLNEKSDEFVIPWVQIVADWKTQLILDANLTLLKPSRAKRVAYLKKLMGNPPKHYALLPHRPAEIYFEEKGIIDEMRLPMKKLEIRAYHHPERDLVNDFMDSFTEHHFARGPKPPPGILSGKGVTLRAAEGFFKAATDFFKAEPWLWLENNDILKIQVGSKTRPLFVSIMGAAGLNFGLSIEETWEDIVETYTNGAIDEVKNPNGRHIMTFNEPPMISVEDVVSVEQYGWPVPSIDFFPNPLHALPGNLTRPDGGMINWYEAVLRAIPIFVAEFLDTYSDWSHPPVEAVIDVETSRGKQQVRITYPAGDLAQLKTLLRKSRAPMDSLEDADSPIPFDRRLLEAQTSKILEGLEGYEPIGSEKAREAQSIIYEAWEETDPTRRVDLAHKALAVFPDCADAFNLLAEEADTYQESLSYYQEGVEAGRRALGEAFFANKENREHFWQILETRPYMRALANLGNMLWELDRVSEAEEIYRELLLLNPNDNQGIRYSLLSLLFEMGKLQEARNLIQEYPTDPTAEWLYCRLLLDFQIKGPKAKLARDLDKALAANPYVPAYLLETVRLPDTDPQRLTLGGEEEAISYARSFRKYWRRTPGAVDWLKANI